jgi:hypothetical protein
MAAPAVTARSARAPLTTHGGALRDGYQSLLVFAVAPTVEIWEKTIKPPGVDGGDPISITTMLNIAWRTMAARALKTLTNSQFKGAFNPILYSTIISIINDEDSVSLHLPNLASVSFFGYLKSAEFDDLAEGNQPEGTFQVIPTNYDPVNHVEAGPVYTAPPPPPPPGP